MEPSAWVLGMRQHCQTLYVEPVHDMPEVVPCSRAVTVRNASDTDLGVVAAGATQSAAGRQEETDAICLAWTSFG